MRVVMRVAGLPVGALDAITMARSWAAVSEATALGRWLRAESSQIADELYTQIAGTDGQDRARLVALRRAVYAGRRLAPQVWNAQTRSLLSRVLIDRLDEWERRFRARNDVVTELPAMIDDELGGADGRLWHALQAPAFCYGLLQGSPVLAAELRKWLADPARGAPQRQTVLRLVKYLARVVAKTSPYSTFTICGPLPVDEAQDELVRPAPRLRWTSVAEVNLWVLGRLAKACGRNPELRSRLRVRGNPSLTEDGTRYRFLAPAVAHPVATAGRGPALDACLDFVREQSSCTIAALSEHLRSLDPTLAEPAVRRFVDQVVDAGLLCELAPYPDQCDDHVIALAEWLDSSADATLGEIAGGLRKLGADLAGYPGLVNVADRARAGQAIVSRVHELVELAEAGSDERDSLPRKNIFHENAVFTEPAAVGGAPAWRSIADELRAVGGLLRAIDPMRPARVAFAQAFLARYGPGVSVSWLDFYQYVVRRMAAKEDDGVGPSGAVLAALSAGPLIGGSTESWWQLPFAREQADRVAAGTDFVLSRAAGSDGVVDLSAAELNATIGTPADSAGAPHTESIACYLQLTDASAADGEVVLNGVISGYGRGLSRIDRQVRLAAGAEGCQPWHPVDRDADGAQLLETDNIFGSNLNLRSANTRFELDFPFTTSVRQHDARVPLNDLEIEYDARASVLRLRSRRSGAPLRPLHGGLMAGFWLPEPLRLLITLFGPSETLLQSTVPPFVPRGTNLTTGGMRRLPRVRVGRVVLSRRCWVFITAEIPRRHKGDGEAGHWLRLAEWLAEHDLPHQFYLRCTQLTGAAWRPDQKSRKPVYVDLSSIHMAELLERAIGQTEGLVIITEALPALSGAPCYAGQRHVTEFLVEVPA